MKKVKLLGVINVTRKTSQTLPAIMDNLEFYSIQVEEFKAAEKEGRERNLKKNDIRSL